MLGSLLDSTKKRVVLGAVVAVLLIGGVGFALVSGSGEENAEPTTTSTTTTEPPTTTTTEPPPVAPLTGLEGEHEGRIHRPALVVKIDNVDPNARPQVGINEADVVYEERVEGSVTRFVAVFHSTDSVPVGPVRSGRTSDIAIFSALNHPFFAWSGANNTFAARIRAASMADAGYDAIPGEYFREPSRRAPYNLMLKSTATIMGLPNEGGGPPPQLFQYRAEGEQTPHLEPAAGVHIVYGRGAGSAPVDYQWDGSGWARSQRGSPHVDVAGRQVAPANVIVQFVDYAPTDVVDQFGVPIPEAQLVGEGDAWVLTNGGIVGARWSKPSLEAVTTYTDASGQPVKLTPGRTWVALAPPGSATRR